jgi:hypothetical protein
MKWRQIRQQVSPVSPGEASEMDCQGPLESEDSGLSQIHQKLTVVAAAAAVVVVAAVAAASAVD